MLNQRKTSKACQDRCFLLLFFVLPCQLAVKTPIWPCWLMGGEEQEVKVLCVLLHIQYITIRVMPFFRPVKTKKRSKRYDKVSHKCRVMLLKKVICDHSEIKESAEQLQINYSTAKTLLRKYKYHGHQINKEVLQGICEWYSIYDVKRERCQYRYVGLLEETVKVECVSGGEEQGGEEQKGEMGGSKQKWREGATQVEILQQVLFKD